MDGLTLHFDYEAAVRILAIVWGLGGIELILVIALVRLTPWATELLDLDLTLVQVVFGVLWILFMAYTEGYRGFQLRFSPTVVARSWHLARSPRPLHLLLAPLFCMGFFHASRRRLITSWGLTIGIVGIVLLVKLLNQPWRGLVDLGVLVGLTWGALSIVWLALEAVRNGGTSADPQLPA